MVERVVASSDCERCLPGLLTQPVNTLSSLAYVIAGTAMLRRTGTGRTTDRAVAWATIAVGLGSVAYHGPGGALSRYAHDASLLAMLGFVAWSDAEIVARAPARTGLAVVPLAAAAGAAPRWSSTAQALAGVAATVGEAARLRRDAVMADGSGRATSPPPAAAVAALAVGLAAQVLGRTGGPWCRPDALLQPHAVWHVLTAASMWGRSRSPGH